MPTGDKPKIEKPVYSKLKKLGKQQKNKTGLFLYIFNTLSYQQSCNFCKVLSFSPWAPLIDR